MSPKFPSLKDTHNLSIIFKDIPPSPYDTLFEDVNKMENGISKHFTYSEFFQ